MTRRRSATAFVIALGAVLGLGVAGCTKKDSLILLDLRASGPLGAPVVRIRLTAKGWPTKNVDGTIDAAGFRVGYYGPGAGKAVSVIAEALDAADCVLASGEATVPKLEAGATSAPTTLFVRPRSENGCVVDAGTPDSSEDAPGEDAPGEDAPQDAGQDAGQDVGEGGGEDAPSDIAADVPSETGSDEDGGKDTGEADAGTDASATDAGDDEGRDAGDDASAD
jgi:hypothetical protein